MDDITKTPYAEWLEKLLRDIMKRKPIRMGVVLITADGEAVTGYFGDHSPGDVAEMAWHLHTDAIWEVISANADKIVEMAKEMEEPEDAD